MAIDSIYEHWWKEDEPYGRIFSQLEYLDNTQEHRREAFLHYLRLYSNRLAMGLSSRDYALQDSGERIKLNVIKSVIDAATAHIATNRPRPMFMTFGGDYSLRKKAKSLGKFVTGQFYATDQYMLSQDVFKDACIFGIGYQKVYEDDGDIYTERVFPHEIIVDDNESKYGDPRQLFQHKEMNREVAAELWPEFAEEIRGAKLIRDDTTYREALVDPVSVVEAWHLPSIPGADDGRHVVCVSNATLVDEPWERAKFPFAVFRWSKSPLGWHGIGLAEELVSIQIEINYLLQKIQRLMTLATSQIWVKKGSGVTSSSLNNQDWAIREYKDQPPVHMAVQSVSQEYFSHVDRLYARAFEIAGVSQLAAQSKKPAGLNSGEAIRSYNDIASQRFQHVGQRYEQFHLDVAELMIECAREAEDRGDGDLRVLAQGDKEIEEIKFSDVSIEKDKYTMRVFPTSLLPDTPAGKLQTIKELMEISPEMHRYAMHLLDMPDVENIRSMVIAPVELIDKTVERILDEGEYSPPLPFMDLDMARQRGTMMLLRAEVDNVPEERLELLRRWVEQVDEMQAVAAAPQTASPAEVPPGPPASPLPQGPAPQGPPQLPPQAAQLPIQ